MSFSSRIFRGRNEDSRPNRFLPSILSKMMSSKGTPKSTSAGTIPPRPKASKDDKMPVSATDVYGLRIEPKKRVVKPEEPPPELSMTESSPVPAISTGTGTNSVAPPAGAPEKKLCCDKCDGKHLTEACPYFKKERDDHPDARKSKNKIGGVSKLPGDFYATLRVCRQPGDGSCLFHSLSYGLKDGSSASVLRSLISSFIHKNPHYEISETPLSDWVKWDTNMSPGQYAQSIAGGGWGGGIEMAIVSCLKGVNIHVYERKQPMGFKRISAFDHPQAPEKRRIVRVLYCGRNHYGESALIINAS